MSAFRKARRGEWQWTLMLRQPPAVDAKLLTAARGELLRKKQNAALPLVRLRKLAEGTCAQVLHLGPYAAETPTIASLHRFIEERGYELAGKHHEIYLSQPGRGDPARMRTVIRQPVRRAPVSRRAGSSARAAPRAR